MEINAASHSFKSFHQITPSHRRHIPVRRERLHQRGTVFCSHPIGRSPQTNAGFRKLGEKGSLTANQKVFPTEKCRGLPGGGVAVRFGAASCASLVVCFCWQEQFYLLPGKFPSRRVFTGLKKPENSEAPFRNPFQRGGMGG